MINRKFMVKQGSFRYTKAEINIKPRHLAAIIRKKIIANPMHFAVITAESMLNHETFPFL